MSEATANEKGAGKMNDGILKQFSAAILAAASDMPMSAPEIESAIREYGLEHFLMEVGGNAAELAEMAGLMSKLSGGNPYGH